MTIADILHPTRSQVAIVERLSDPDVLVDLGPEWGANDGRTCRLCGAVGHNSRGHGKPAVMRRSTRRRGGRFVTVEESMGKLRQGWAYSYLTVALAVFIGFEESAALVDGLKASRG